MLGTSYELSSETSALVGPWLALLLLFALLLVLAWRLSVQPRTKILALTALCAVLGAAWLFGQQVRGLGVELAPSALVLHGTVRTEIDKSLVYADRARVVDLDAQPSFEIMRALDTGLGGGQGSGWAVLRNGMVVFALVGSGRRWVLIPTQDHYYLAVSVQETDALVRDLKAWSGPSPTAS